MTPNPTDRDGLVERLLALATSVECDTYTHEEVALLRQAAAALREDARDAVDAARYRWLRANPHGTRFRVPCPDSIPTCRVGHRGPCLMRGELDAAIDAAMQTPSGDGGADQERTHG